MSHSASTPYDAMTLWFDQTFVCVLTSEVMADGWTLDRRQAQLLTLTAMCDVIEHVTRELLEVDVMTSQCLWCWVLPSGLVVVNDNKKQMVVCLVWACVCVSSVTWACLVGLENFWYKLYNLHVRCLCVKLVIFVMQRISFLCMFVFVG